jgi:hypothetical protein
MDQGERAKIVVGALKECRSVEAVEEVFSLFHIAGFSERMRMLDECMGSPETSYWGEPCEKDQYEIQVQIFLAGIWRLNEVYERTGF